jgi:hypothetical protein
MLKTAIEDASSTDLTGTAFESRPSSPRASRISALFGQGLVIVASVLIALAADRMMKRVDERALERTYLQGLHEDFNNIEAVTSYARTSAAQRDSAAALVLATLRGSGSTGGDGIKLARSLVLAGWVIEIRFPRDTWDDMVATGHLGVLRNADLRRQIAAFYKQATQFEVHARDWVQMTRDYSDAVRTVLDPELQLAIGIEFIYREPISPGLAPRPADIIRRMTGQPVLLSTIGDVLLINKVSVRGYAELSNVAQRIKKMISDELAG